MKRRKYATIRIVKRGITQKRPTLSISGDMYTTNETYRTALEFILKWKPDKDIKDFVDTYISDYCNIIKKDNIEIKLYYPLDFTELVEYICRMYQTDNEMREILIKSNDMHSLECALKIMRGCLWWGSQEKI